MATYEEINWQNNASTPINASNLNKMDEAIKVLYASNTGTQQVLVDPTIGNDSTGTFGDSTRPFKTINAVIDALTAGSNTEIFIRGNVTLSGEHRLQSASAIIMAYGEGTPNPGTDTSRLTFGTGSKLRLSSGSNISFFIDVTFSSGSVTNGSVLVGDSCGAHLMNHRVHDFTNSPQNNNYVSNGRTSQNTVTTGLSVPIITCYGASASYSLSGCNITDTAAGTLPVLFSIISGSSISARFGEFTFNNSTAAPEQDLASRFAGIKKQSNGTPFNIISPVDFSILSSTIAQVESLSDIDLVG